MGERRYKLAPSWRGLATQAHADCRFVTIIIGAIRVNDLDMRDPSSVSQVVEGMIAGFRRDWSGLTKGRAFPGLWWRGQFELELHREIPRESHREALLKDLGLDVPALGRDERVLVVHVHLVAVLPPGIDADDLRARFTRTWPGRWRTEVKGLYAHQTTEEAVTRLCSYVHKHRLEYSSGGLAGEPVRFEDAYGIGWGRFVNKVYRAFSRVFRSKL